MCPNAERMFDSLLLAVRLSSLVIEQMRVSFPFRNQNLFVTLFGKGDVSANNLSFDVCISGLVIASDPE